MLPFPLRAPSYIRQSQRRPPPAAVPTFTDVPNLMIYFGRTPR